jgi:8-oxo-dGTP pyrophosphatase MutT (NUDIX family)
MTEQVGAIPFRQVNDHVEFLIITTRTSGRWICPKGNVEAEHGQVGSAHLEAFEEAGVEGNVLHPDLGTYDHGETLTPVRMWLLRVEQIYDAWPEDHERTRRWLDAPEAQSTVDEPGLRRLMETALDRLRAA